MGGRSNFPIHVRQGGTGPLSYRIITNGLQNGCYRVVRQGFHFVVRAVLNGVGHINRGGTASDGFGLGHCGFLELARGNKDSGKTPAFQVGDIVHTARGARTSVRQGLDHRMALRADGLLQLGGEPDAQT